METRALAIKLGALEVISIEQRNDGLSNCKQFYDYLFVLDFEATCWKNNDKKLASEIIEFPIVLYDINHQQILDEFQHYVKPTENPILSKFCTKLTGIKQSQVDNGISLEDCLNLATQWISEKLTNYNMEFNTNQGNNGKSKCIFATWSDWDLGTCLKNECSRKGINIQFYFTERIDLRALYRRNYIKTFTGLSGALANVGLRFQGRQHCGLDDARNTAFLAGRMVTDGILLEK